MCDVDKWLQVGVHVSVCHLVGLLPPCATAAPWCSAAGCGSGHRPGRTPAHISMHSYHASRVTPEQRIKLRSRRLQTSGVHGDLAVGRQVDTAVYVYHTLARLPPAGCGQCGIPVPLHLEHTVHAPLHRLIISHYVHTDSQSPVVGGCYKS